MTVSKPPSMTPTHYSMLMATTALTAALGAISLGGDAVAPPTSTNATSTPAHDTSSDGPSDSEEIPTSQVTELPGAEAVGGSPLNLADNGVSQVDWDWDAEIDNLISEFRGDPLDLDEDSLFVRQSPETQAWLDRWEQGLNREFGEDSPLFDIGSPLVGTPTEGEAHLEHPGIEVEGESLGGSTVNGNVVNANSNDSNANAAGEGPVPVSRPALEQTPMPLPLPSSLLQFTEDGSAAVAEVEPVPASAPAPAPLPEPLPEFDEFPECPQLPEWYTAAAEGDAPREPAAPLDREPDCAPVDDEDSLRGDESEETEPVFDDMDLSEDGPGPGYESCVVEPGRALSEDDTSCFDRFVVDMNAALDVISEGLDFQCIVEVEAGQQCSRQDEAVLAALMPESFQGAEVHGFPSQVPAPSGRTWEEEVCSTAHLLELARVFPGAWEVLVGLYLQEVVGPRAVTGRGGVVGWESSPRGVWEPNVIMSLQRYLYPESVVAPYTLPQGHEGEILQSLMNQILAHEDIFRYAINLWIQGLTASDDAALEEFLLRCGWLPLELAQSGMSIARQFLQELLVGQRI
jgi:hypothetical protein